ncbi:hypothetical protein A7979_05670 [Rothia nasimurium]|uniref:Uncharacterized protein n=1 Tax=Rothia nasimurium TaxID=85336 RepID=A0A1Y1RN95_9MICC|nr:hypothetical protein [Rothia nasimurium]ORC16089.1 hypothetical protein A7979_05670 [Rothia nasimurium]
MATYRSKTALTSAFLIGALAFAGCGAANDAADSASNAAESASASQGLTDEQKGQVETTIKDYFTALATAEMPAEPPADIQEILSQVNSSADFESLEGIASALSPLSDEDKQKLDDYVKGLDPTYDLFDRSDISVEQSIVLSLVSLGMGNAATADDQESIATITVDTDKVTFTEDTATLPADAFSIGGSASAESSESAVSGNPFTEGPGVIFDGTVLKLENGEWKIDAASYLKSLDQVMAASNQ